VRESLATQLRHLQEFTQTNIFVENTDDSHQQGRFVSQIIPRFDDFMQDNPKSRKCALFSSGDIDIFKFVKFVKLLCEFEIPALSRKQERIVVHDHRSGG
jgi:hypothetical protein